MRDNIIMRRLMAAGYKIPMLFCCMLGSASLDAQAGTERLAPPLKELTTGLQVTPAERSAGAIVVRHLVSASVQSDGNANETEYLAVTVLDDKAVADYRQISSYFNSYFTQTHLDFARVLDSHGNVHEASADAIQTQAPNQAYMLDDQRILTFALPGLEKGATLEFQVSYASKPVVGRNWFAHDHFHYVHWASENNWPRVDPVRFAKIVIDMPADEKLNYAVSLLSVKPSQTTATHRTTYTWETHDLPKVPVEDAMRSLYAVIPGLEVSTIPDWAAVDTWGKSIYLPASAGSDAERRIVSGLITDNMERQQRIEALFYYVQKNIRYIDAHLSRGGYAPHDSGEILRNRYGDCKDQAILLVSLLRAAGIKAYPAMVSRSAGVRPTHDVPSLSFSHMIAYVPDEHGGLWLDTTGSTWQFPGIDASLEGSMAFVVTGEGGQLLTIPQSSAEKNTVAMQVTYSYGKDSITGHVEVKTTGTISDRLKAGIKNNPQMVEQLKGMIKGVYPSATAVSVSVDNNIESKVPLTFSAAFDYPKGWSEGQETVSYMSSLTPMLSMFTSFMNMPSPESRIYDYNAGMPMTLTLQTHCPAPSKDYKPLIEVPGQSLESFAFSTRVNQSVGADGVDVTTRFILPSPVIEKARYAEFIAQLNDAVKQSTWRMSFKKDGNYAMETNLEKNLQTSSRSVDAILAMAHHELDTANYAKARDLAKEAVGKDPVRGEAHYLLGIALGFLDDYQTSEQALQKAKALGYRP